MKNVFIYAYTRFNLGDDLFIKVLCERYPEINFMLYGPRKYKKLFKNIKNLKIIPNDIILYRGIDVLLRKLNINKSVSKLWARKNDAAVYIGGSIFMQQGNWKKNFKYKKNMRIKNKPFYIIGANFGPFEDDEFYYKYNKVFKEYTDVCFRDKYSYDLFKELGNVRLASDVIFQLDPGQTKTKSKEKNIVISVIKPSYRKSLDKYDNIYYEKVRDIIIKFIEEGFSVTLMSFCEHEGDKEAIKEIRALLSKKYLKHVNSYFYKYDIDEALSVIENSSLVVGTRFHSMILGWVYQKPVYPIAYSKKMTNVIRDIDFEGAYTDFDGLYNIKIDDVYNSLETNYTDVTGEAKRARKQFAKLDEFLLE